MRRHESTCWTPTDNEATGLGLEGQALTLEEAVEYALEGET